MISRNGRFDGKNTFTTPKNLAPSTWYAFRVRDFDVQGIICTQWSAWTAFKTAATNQVNIEIDYSGTSVVIGSGLVGVDGTFGAFVQIPANVPPGVYLLRAVQAGATLAQTPITVVGQGQALPPILQIINPDTGLAYLGQAEAIGGYPITVRLQNFQAGQVSLYVDSASGISLGSVTVTGSGPVSAVVTWPLGATGQHNLLAQQQQGNVTASASAAVFGQFPPQ